MVCYVSVVKVNKYSAFANFVYLKLLYFHFRLSRAASCSSLEQGPEAVMSKRALLEREALLLLVTYTVVVHCLQRVKVQSYGLAGKEAGRKEHRIRAQNRNFCALLPSGTPVFRHFEHKIEVFVRFCRPEHPFSGVLSTKSAFLCSGRRGLASEREEISIGKNNHGLPANHRAHF